MIIEQPSIFLRWIYPRALWRMNRHEKAVYLTFDDGPIPEATPFVLDILDHFQIKATFFMVGDNVRKHPDIFRMVVERGHRIGNHTYNHIGGFKYLSKNYLANADKANETLHTDLFRPPHGWMRWIQYLLLRKKYRIVMWDLVTRDYSKRVTAEDVFHNVKKYTRNGSIITFHDSLKSIEKLRTALPQSIQWLKEQGYTFKTFD
ncbi:MAG: polysaccharide deacetylase family protein [Candidatus Paraprevotella stercoravium]|uniref:Polysaccharide deacetylase family protein n=1 Tax=Candidatus Paraprevotella stercoravium TaxID=2838725 RepID=A0A9E2L7M5_9BACT|nr:polysaccharide deacetylase family protein [Candidatus Paraprevotella stercoravium]